MADDDWNSITPEKESSSMLNNGVTLGFNLKAILSSGKSRQPNLQVPQVGQLSKNTKGTS